MRSNHTREERRKIVEECMQSGKSQIAFAQEHGLKPNTLSGWITEFRKEPGSQSAYSHLVELKKPSGSKSKNIVIRKAGIEIEFPAECSAAVLKEILSAAAAL